MARPLRPTRKVRPQPPTGVAMTYARVLRRWLVPFQDKIETILLDGWERNPVHFGGQVQDASSFVRRKLGQLDLILEEAFNPQDLAGEIEILASRINKKGLLEFRRAVGVSLHSETGIPAALEKFRTRNVDLIRSLAGDQKDRVTDLLDKAERGAWRVEELRKELQGTFNVSKSKADLLARDQVLKLNGQITQMRQQNAGITEYIWRTSRDERVRGNPSGKWPNGMHYDLDGSRQQWASPPVISEDGRTGHPGDDYQCRCTAEPVLSLLEE